MTFDRKRTCVSDSGTRKSASYNSVSICCAYINDSSPCRHAHDVRICALPHPHSIVGVSAQATPACYDYQGSVNYLSVDVPVSWSAPRPTSTHCD